ncbi:hypothetical protein MPS38_003035 [Salmonella enterica]|nr:hypothetical protein [Salmonella enterica]
MFIPVWFLVSVLVWASFSVELKNFVALFIASLSVAVVAVVVLVVAGVSLATWWAETVPPMVNGVLFLIGLVVYVGLIIRGCKSYCEDKEALPMHKR